MYLTLVWITAAFAGGRVEGVVRFGGSPLGQIAVRAQSEETGESVEVFTGPDGVWVLPLVGGAYVVTVAPEADRATHTRLMVDEAAVTELAVDLAQPAPAPLEVLPPRAVEPGTRTAPVSGKVQLDTGELVAGANVFVRGWPAAATTDGHGGFTLELPVGSWGLVVAGSGIETTVLEPVDVPASGTVVVEVYPSEEEVTSGATVEVEGAAIRDDSAPLLQERQTSAAVTDVISAGQMSRAGDSDAASALRRVTGLSVVGGKYVYVRGLGDRYSATTLNGSSLPSPEPEKRVVPLDLFPTALLDGVVIQKTYSPELGGEFGGGVVQLRTRSIPDHTTFSLGVNGTYVAGTSFTSAADAPRGPTDWLGFGRAWRRIPDVVENATADQPLAPQTLFSDGGFSPEALEEYGEAFPNHWAATPRDLPPDFSVNTSGGGSVPLGGATLGVLAGGVFSNGWSVEDGYIDNFSVTQEGQTQSRRTEFAETANTIRLGTMATASLAWGEDEHLRLVSLYDRNSVASAIRWSSAEPSGEAGQLVPVSESIRVGWREQELLFEQLSMRGRLGPFVLEGRYALSFARSDEPDRRQADYGVSDGGVYLNLNGISNEMQYTSLHDHAEDGNLALVLPVRLASGDARFSAGGGWFRRTRSSTTDRFAYLFHGTEGIDLSAPPQQIFTDANIGAESPTDSGWIEISELTSNADDYTADQHLWSLYALADVPWSVRVRTQLGARYEASDQGVATFERFAAEDAPPVVAALPTRDLLPAAALTLGIGPEASPGDMLVRLGYGRTVSRPELRELSAVPYYDYRTRRLNFGNPDLEHAVIDNVDLRWEWYPRQGETLSVGGFFKHFENPIEAIVAVSSVSGDIGTFANATRATNLGVEVEARKALDVLGPAFADFYVTGNVAFVHSRVDLALSDGQQTSATRPLQGQSPFLCNVLLGYDHAATGTVVNLVYDVAGPRIVGVGTSGIPDTYELPVHRVDLLFTQAINAHWKARLKGSNLLSWPARERVGEAISQEVSGNWSLGLGVSWSG